MNLGEKYCIYFVAVVVVACAIVVGSMVVNCQPESQMFLHVCCILLCWGTYVYCITLL
jgi:hypothetical protein